MRATSSAPSRPVDAPASSRADLRRVGRERVVLRRLRRLAESISAPAPRSASARRAPPAASAARRTSRRRDRRLALRTIGPASSAGTIRMIVTPVSLSPCRIAAWIGAAPRSAGSSDAWMFSVPSARQVDHVASAGCARTRRRSRCPAASAASIVDELGVRAASPAGSTGSPSSSAISLHRRRIELERERPVRLVGLGDDADHLEAFAEQRAQRRRANSGVPQKRTRI